MSYNSYLKYMSIYNAISLFFDLAAISRIQSPLGADIGNEFRPAPSPASLTVSVTCVLI